MSAGAPRSGSRFPGRSPRPSLKIGSRSRTRLVVVQSTIRRSLGPSGPDDLEVGHGGETAVPFGSSTGTPPTAGAIPVDPQSVRRVRIARLPLRDSGAAVGQRAGRVAPSAQEQHTRRSLLRLPGRPAVRPAAVPKPLLVLRESQRSRSSGLSLHELKRTRADRGPPASLLSGGLHANAWRGFILLAAEACAFLMSRADQAVPDYHLLGGTDGTGDSCASPRDAKRSGPGRRRSRLTP